MPLATYLPTIDNRRYDDILAELRTRIPRYTPEWTDLNDNDPGITLAQLFAWLTDMLLYRLGRVPELNYLKFLELLGMELLPAEPAVVEITFPVAGTATAPTVIVPARTQVSAESTDSPAPIVFETDRALVALAAELASLQSFDGFSFRDLTEANRDASQGFQPFGPAAAKDSAFYLGFRSTGPLPRTELNLAVVVRQEGAARGVSCDALRTVPHASATIAWEYWNGTEWRALDLLKDETLALTRSGHVYLRTPAPGLIAPDVFGEVPDPRHWIRARLTSAQYERAPTLTAVRTNTIAATQAETVRDEVLGGSDGRPNQVFKVANTPVLRDTLRLEVNEGDGFVAWTRADDFFGAGPHDRHYVLDRTTGEVRFGDGVHGAIPVGNSDLPGSNVVAREYRFGGGVRGNVAPGKITTLLTSIEGIDDAGVGNLLAATSGRPEETLDEAKLRVPRAIRSRCRAVTNEDFEQLAMQSANVRRAKALPLTHPEFPGVKIPGVVTVIVVPDGEAPNPTPSEGTLRSVCAYLNQARLLTTELYVVPPRYQRVHVTAEVVAEDGADLAEVKKAIDQALTDYFHPLRGGEQGQGWPFGGDIFYSRVYGRASVSGVQRIERLVIALDGKEAPECSNLPVCDGVLLFSDGHAVTVTYDVER
jgi:predicted phage baseplate assembly protein